MGKIGPFVLITKRTAPVMVCDKFLFTVENVPTNNHSKFENEFSVYFWLKKFIFKRKEDPRNKQKNQNDSKWRIENNNPDKYTSHQLSKAILNNMAWLIYANLCICSVIEKNRQKRDKISL